MKSNAQRQKEYRARRTEGEGERQLNCWISNSAHYALKRLAAHHGLTKKEMLERLLCAEDKKILDTLDDDSREWVNYFVANRS